MMTRALLLISLMIASGCATGHPLTRAEIEPVSTVRIMAVAPDQAQLEALKGAIAGASAQLTPQVGIALEVVASDFYTLKALEMEKGLEELQKRYDCRNGGWDIVIISSTRTPAALMATVIGGWTGAIDDQQRRYMILRDLTPHTIMHETAHAFLTTMSHSDSGLMTAFSIQVLPLIPLRLESNTLSEQDAREMLKNKWRKWDCEWVVEKQ
jgi:hypothetical protein